MILLLKCPEHGYTLQENCPVCGAASAKPGPAKYSPEDPYGRYRRQLKLLDREEKREEKRKVQAPARVEGSS